MSEEKICRSKKVKTSTEAESNLWNVGSRFVVGVDEAGRGPLAGPVVVAAVVIDGECTNELDSALLQDSKCLSPKKLEKAFLMLTTCPKVHYEISIVNHLEIDQLNILQASLTGMDRAITALKERGKCSVILVDGPYKPPVAAKDTLVIVYPIINGDASVRVIAAASILAKLTRDRIMLEYHQQYPQYGFNQHKGYPTKKHREALAEHGACEIHRKSFGPVKRAMMNGEDAEDNTIFV